ncbi:hypothetical protein TWF694_003435 [Orbilia ellipsospora]|uniref:Uncharacterized protein n=1 Tax=Orbilia ellipsospora TaxID=2528407 RepID=A0AAV9X0C1_9PEZI
MSVHASGPLRCRFIKNFPLCIDIEYEVDHPWLALGDSADQTTKESMKFGVIELHRDIKILSNCDNVEAKRPRREEEAKRWPACRVDRYEVSSFNFEAQAILVRAVRNERLVLQAGTWCGSPPTPLELYSIRK